MLERHLDGCSRAAMKEEFEMVKRLAVLICGVALSILPAACSQSDAGITTSVKSKLAADDTVKSYRIDVDTKDRVVTLSGAVDTPAARERAMQLARSTEGVNDVVDRLTVTPGATPTTGTDDKIQSEAREAAREGRDKTADERREAGEKAADAKREGREAGRDAASTVTDAGVTTAVKSKLLAADDVPG